MNISLSDMPNPTSGILGYFPKPEFRPKQRPLIQAIYDAFEKDNYNYVLLEAPTGLGKSAIGMTFTKYYRSSYILTAQKVLQDQYKGDFPNDITVMKGRGAYLCLTRNDDGSSRTCALGLCTVGKEVSCRGICPYRRAFQKALSSRTVALSYDGYFYQNAYGQGWPERSLVVIDECQNLEKKFLNFNELNINDKKSSQPLPEFSRIKDYDPFLIKLKSDSTERIRVLDEYAVTESDLKELKDLNALVNKIEIYFSTRDELEYVFTYRDFGSYRNLTFQPIFVSNFIRRDIFHLEANQVNPSSRSKFLMMSATILDKRMFCESVGLDPSQVKFIKVGSTFPRENRPVYKTPVGSMSYKNKSQTMPKMLKAIRTLINQYPDVRGIIHTVSEANAEAIRQSVPDSRLTFRRDFTTVPEALIEHMRKPNSILVASGLSEGVDLKDEMSRFQILIKVPYLSLGDARIKRRAALSWPWYSYMTCLTFVQTLGRSIRSPEDYADTYLLDSDFEAFLNRQRRLIPSYIKESIQPCKSIEF